MISIWKTICNISSIQTDITPHQATPLLSNQRPLSSPITFPLVALSIVQLQAQQSVIQYRSYPAPHLFLPLITPIHLEQALQSFPCCLTPRIRPFLLFTVGSLTSQYPAPLIKLYTMIPVCRLSIPPSYLRYED